MPEVPEYLRVVQSGRMMLDVPRGELYRWVYGYLLMQTGILMGVNPDATTGDPHRQLDVAAVHDGNILLRVLNQSTYVLVTAIDMGAHPCPYVTFAASPGTPADTSGHNEDFANPLQEVTAFAHLLGMFVA